MTFVGSPLTHPGAEVAAAGTLAVAPDTTFSHAEAGVCLSHSTRRRPSPRTATSSSRRFALVAVDVVEWFTGEQRLHPVDESGASISDGSDTNPSAMQAISGGSPAAGVTATTGPGSGDILAARRAGMRPAMAPMRIAAANPPAQATVGTTIAQLLAGGVDGGGGDADDDADHTAE